MQIGKENSLISAVLTRLTPICDLEGDEDTYDDDYEIEPNCEPVLVFDVFCDAAADHWVSSCSMPNIPSSIECNSANALLTFRLSRV